VADKERNVSARLYRCAPREGLNPADLELLPRHQRGSRSREIRFAAPNGHTRLIDVRACGAGFQQSYWAVRQRQLLRFANEPRDALCRRTSS
jgi:hypothetical protein